MDQTPTRKKKKKKKCERDEQRWFADLGALTLSVIVTAAPSPMTEPCWSILRIRKWITSGDENYDRYHNAFVVRFHLTGMGEWYLVLSPDCLDWILR